MVKSAPRRSCAHFGAVVFVSSVIAGSAAWAQSPPGGGTILRQIDSPTPSPAAPTPQLRLPAETRSALPASSDLTVNVSGLRISGATVFSERQLMPLVVDAIGSALNIQELDAIADRITRFYRDRGYLVARAYLPAQEVEAGRVEIAVIEGAYSGFSVQNHSLLSSEHFSRYLAPLQTSPVIHDKILERSLLLLGDAAGVGAITPTLAPGNQVGGANLRELSAERRWPFQVALLAVTDGEHSVAQIEQRLTQQCVAGEICLQRDGIALNDAASLAALMPGLVEENLRLLETAALLE
jgi:hemolysin activation/secretion protein